MDLSPEYYPTPKGYVQFLGSTTVLIFHFTYKSIRKNWYATGYNQAVNIRARSNIFQIPHFFSILILSSALVALVLAIYIYVPDLGIDWRDTYRPATLDLLSLQSPYQIKSYLNPPWVLIPLIPLAFLPVKIGAAILAVINLCSFLYAAIRLGAKPPAAIAILLSHPILFAAWYGQIDGILTIGLSLPPQIGLFFVLSKPQIGLMIALFWLIEAWRNGRTKEVFRIFAPVSLAFIVSFLFFGFWPTQSVNPNYEASISLFPQSIPIGLALFVYALQKRKAGPAISSSPFLSPYLGPHGWSTALMGMIPNTWIVIVGVIGIWIVRFLSFYFPR